MRRVWALERQLAPATSEAGSSSATTVLVTGALGHYGTQLVRILAAREGWTVLASDMKPRLRPPTRWRRGGARWSTRSLISGKWRPRPRSTTSSRAATACCTLAPVSPTLISPAAPLAGRCAWLTVLPGTTDPGPAGVAPDGSQLGGRVAGWSDQPGVSANYTYELDETVGQVGPEAIDTTA